MPNHKFLIFLVFISVLYACGDLEKSQENRERIAEELKAREIKYIPPSQLLDWTLYQGQTICRVSQKMLNRKFYALQAAEEDSSLVVRDFIEQVTLSDMDSLLNESTLYIHKFPLELSSASQATKWEKEYLKEYKEGNSAMESKVRPLPGDSSLLFVAPIVLDGKTQGMWSIEFDKAKLILNTNMKEFRKFIGQG